KIYFFAILVFPLSMFADTIVFDKTFGGSENDYAYSIQETKDGGYIVAGQTDSFGNGSSLKPDMWIIKLDSNGDSLWTKIYEGTIVSSAHSIQQTMDGGYIVVGKGEENILKLDRNGKKEWGKHYSRVFYSVEQTTNGGYIAAGDSIYHQLEWDYIPSVSIIKLDENGNKEWSNPLGNDFIGRANSIQQTMDGGYIVAGDSVDFRSEFDYSHYLIVIKLDENGNKEWNYFGSEYSSAKSIQQTEDNGYIIAGDTRDDGHGLDFLIIKLDENGNENWIKIYGSSGGWEYASAIQQTSDGGYSVAGQTDSYGTGRYDMWILKLDENGNGPGPDGISYSHNNHFKGFSLSQNYPNPFNPSTIIRFSLPKSLLVSLKVYNFHGKEVNTLISEYRHAGKYEVKWNAEDFPSGIYLYRIETEDYVETRKLILQK
ncbi:T9SS type A sorting domain-containing protein, partial [bacterium]|nr:T9SS type A sorting domain-containing protein [bacterium]